MKLTKSTLKHLIREEIENLRKEVTDDDVDAIMKARQQGRKDYMDNIDASQDAEDARYSATMRKFAGNARLIDAYNDGYHEAHYEFMEEMDD
tara:strand:- start:870 stop:1145 length:276 start_codon:yes stop_codon:yes gene_type:complete